MARECRPGRAGADGGRTPGAGRVAAGRGRGSRMGDMSEPSGQDRGDEQQIMVVGADGQPVGMANIPRSAEAEGSEQGPANMVEQPAKVMRIGTMIKQLLEEVRAAPLDEASRERLREIHENSIKELEQGLAPELREELARLSLPFSSDSTPSEGELRIAQAQLVGWLEGLFHGIQTALFAQQMAARAQLEQMRKGLPPGVAEQMGQGQAMPDGTGRGTGQYL